MLLREEVPVCTAAPAFRMSWVTLRPLSGSSRIRSFSMTLPTPTVRVSTSAVLARDFHGLGDLAYLEHDRNFRVAVDLQRDAGLDERLEAGQRDFQPIRTRGRLGKA